MLARGTVKGWVWWAAVLLVLASLAGRVFALWLAGDRVPLGDPFVYQSLARNLLAGRGLVSDEILELPNLRAFYPPGYPLLLAGIGLVLPLGAATYAVLNTAIDAAASLLIAKVGGEVGDRKGGRIAGLIYFAWPTNIFLAPLAYKEGLVALLMLAVIVALFASARGSGKGTIGFGLATGALVLVQPALAALAPLIGLALRPRFPDWRTWARRMALAASITALVMLPWWVRNYLLFDRFIPMTTAGPLGLWIGATPLGSGSWVRPPDALLVGGELGAAAALSAEAWRIIAADPLRYITHCLAKIPLAFATSEHPLGQLLVMQPIAHKSLILRLMWIPQAATFVLLAAAIAGAVKARRDTLFHMMLAVLLQIIVFSMWFEFAARHRYFMTPILLLLAVAAFRGTGRAKPA